MRRGSVSRPPLSVESVFGVRNSTEPRNTQPVAVLERLDDLTYSDITKSWSSPRQGHRVQPDIREEPLSSDKTITASLNILRAQLRAHIFSVFPLRVMKLPEMKLTERNAVVEYLIQKRLNNIAHETLEELLHIGRGRNATASSGKEARSKKLSEIVKILTKFAVLSHTWGEDEPSFQKFQDDSTAPSQGYKKLQEFCRIAHEQYGVEFAWADTVCINKLSSSELDESIRSMFTWYRESFICIIYLSETDTLLEFPFDRWFTRGWTLQELLAPQQIKFYNKKWRPLTNARNDKLYPRDSASIQNESLQLKLLRAGISAATNISVDHIYNFRPGLQDPPFPERMKWIAKRATTRPEDMAYSMMGALGVSISVAYGEGLPRAFFRLFQAALEVDWSPSWFLWAGDPIPTSIHPSRMIPSSPSCYLSWDFKCIDERVRSSKKEPIALTNVGLPINLLVVPAKVKYYAGRVDPVFAPDRYDADIVCPLSDDTITTTVEFEVGYQRNLVKDLDQFALGVLVHDHGRIHAILLQKKLPKPHYPWVANHGPVPRYGEWERCRMKKILSFHLKDDFRNKGMNDWEGIFGSEPGWIDKPEMKFHTLYL